MEHSDTIGAIAGALAKAQAEIQHAAKDATNPHFQSNYADLASVWEACRAQLSKNAVAVTQAPEADGNKVTVTTILLHASGEWLRSALTMTARDASPQSIGSAITYGRRYGLASMVGVAPDDDDGEAAQPRKGDKPAARTDSAPRPQAAKANGTDAPTTGPDRVISEAQQKRFFAISREKEWTKDDVKKLLGKYGYASSKDIRVADYNKLVESLETGVEPEDDDDDDDGLAMWADDAIDDRPEN